MGFFRNLGLIRSIFNFFPNYVSFQLFLTWKWEVIHFGRPVYPNDILMGTKIPLLLHLRQPTLDIKIPLLIHVQPPFLLSNRPTNQPFLHRRLTSHHLRNPWKKFRIYQRHHLFPKVEDCQKGLHHLPQLTC